METLTLKKSTARKIYKEGSSMIKKIMIDDFGDECFNESIIDQVKTFEDAFAIADEETRQDYCEDRCVSPDAIAYKKLRLIIKVINEGWKPNWKNSSEQKWFPWFRLSSGFGFDVSVYGYANADASSGSRLCLSTKEKSDYVGKQFINLYEDFLTLK
jgi:hypothetical protein